MGTFRVELELVGGHGHDRDAKNGDAVKPCEGSAAESCPDCMTLAFFKAMALKNDTSGGRATITHWPGQTSQVTDVFDFVKGEMVRRGSF